MLPVMRELVESYPDKKYSFITLTVKNCKVEDIRATVKKMAKMWDKIRINNRGLRKELIGFARSFEITYNKKRQDFHPHFHIIAIWDGRAEHREVIRLWLHYARAEGLEVDIKAQDGREIINKQGAAETEEDVTKAVLETYKYETKDEDLENMNIMTFKAFAAQMSGLRSASLGGIIKEIASCQNVTESKLETAGDEEEITACTDCGSLELTRAAAVWSGTKYEWVN
jgi:plasmid rolling circle replication initiator protein Rep